MSEKCLHGVLFCQILCWFYGAEVLSLYAAFFFIPFSFFQVSLKILQLGFWKNLAKDRAVTKRMFFILGDSDGSGGNALWSSGSGAAKGGCFFGRGFPRRR
jgi:hypothetical protein